MATSMDEGQLSLMSLEEELTCSICLSPFDCPVTIPCGHNFCQSCILTTWEDTYSCPQCREHFAVRPELKKNTVLSAVVDTFTQRSSKGRPGEPQVVPTETTDVVIRCDTCMEAEASQTCLTCMASYCEVHLRPHRENPRFLPHQLSAPVSDLSARICSEHHKLMELFCIQHVQPICSLCLQQAHKGCSFSSPEEQRKLQKFNLGEKVDLLDRKILNNETTICEMREIQDKLMDAATDKKKALEAEFQQMHDMLTQEMSDALKAVDQEVQSAHTKLGGLMKKFTMNIDNMAKAREEINSHLSQSQTLNFLKVSFNMPAAVNFDPYTPRISLDSKKVLANQVFSVSLRKHLMGILNQPVEARLQALLAGPASAYTPFGPGAYQETGNPRPLFPQSQDPTSQPGAGPKKKNQKTKKVEGNLASSMENLMDLARKQKANVHPPAEQPNPRAETSNISPNITSAEKRIELIKYGAVLTFDLRTAHKRIALTEGFAKASVTDEQANYPNGPQRFAVCSQVLTSKGFRTGRHYWEVRLSCNNFMGIGLACGSIERKGPDSRLGRNAHSWCVEWFNTKLSAWHNSLEKVLANPSPKRVGVLLDCDGGTVTFYNIADRAYPFYTFRFPITEKVFPAFWIFSGGSSITLCKLQ